MCDSDWVTHICMYPSTVELNYEQHRALQSMMQKRQKTSQRRWSRKMSLFCETQSLRQPQKDRSRAGFFVPERDSPPSSVMTTTIVSGPSPSGLNTRSDTRYCEYVFSPVSVYSCNDKNKTNGVNGGYSYSELSSLGTKYKKAARRVGQMTFRLSLGKLTCLGAEGDFDMKSLASNA